MQGVDPGEVSERAFLKSHLSELVIPSQNPVFNSRAEIQSQHSSIQAKQQLPLSQETAGILMGPWPGLGRALSGGEKGWMEMPKRLRSPSTLQSASTTKASQGD